MSGPIVRTGTTPEVWANWDQVVGKKDAGTKKRTAKKTTRKKTAKKKAK